MNILFKIMITTFGMMFFSAAFSLDAAITTEEPITAQQSSMVFQVVQSQIVFDRATIESATIVPTDATSDQYGINLKLKNDATTKFRALTAKNIGKQANIILNGMVLSTVTIQSQLGGEFLVTGLTKKQAQTFADSIVAGKQ